MITYIKWLYDWMGQRSYSPYASYILGALFFLEANLLLLPADPLLILYCIARPKRAFPFATIATLSSVIGGLVGYLLGATLWDYAGYTIIHNSWVNMALTPENFAYLSHAYHQNQWLAILLAGFTPIPYKAATLSAGFCKLSLTPFVICSFISRGARFYLYAFIISLFGDQIRQSIDRYFNIVVGLTTLIIFAIIWFFKT